MASGEKQYGLIDPKSAKKITASDVFCNDSDSGSDHGCDWIKKSGQKDEKVLKRQAKIEMQRALQQDPTVYQYDEIYDEMMQKKEEAEVSKAPVDRKPKYIQSLMKSADRRKKENERRLERQIQKEREEEGDKFKDKEEFITSSYKQKLEEFKRAEEEERKMEYIESVMDVTKQEDLGGFYRNLYKETVGKEEGSEEKVADGENNDKELKKDNKMSNEPKMERNYRKRSNSEPQEIDGKKNKHDSSSSSSDSDSSSDSSTTTSSSEDEGENREESKAKDIGRISLDGEKGNSEDKNNTEDKTGNKKLELKNDMKNEVKNSDGKVDKSITRSNSGRSSKVDEKDRRESSYRSSNYNDRDRSSKGGHGRSQRNERSYRERERERERDRSRRDDGRYRDRRRSDSRRRRRSKSRSSDGRRGRERSRERRSERSRSRRRNHKETLNTTDETRKKAVKEPNEVLKAKQGKKDEEEIASKPSIWEKRTVGPVFDAALERYYQRKAARSL